MGITFRSSEGTYEVVVSATNPLPIAGSISATNPSVGTNGVAAPASSTEMGWIDGSGNLVATSAANPIPVSGSFSASFAEGTLQKTGSVSSATTLFTQADTTGYYSCFFRIAGIGACTVVAEIENPTDGTWNAITAAPAGTLIGQASVTANGMYYCQTGGKGFRLRVSVYDSVSTVTADAFFRGFGAMPFPSALAISAASLPLPTGAATSALQTTGNTSLASILSSLGSPFQAGASIGNTAFIANAGTNLNTSTLALETGGNLAALNTVLGTKADAKNAATDTTAVSGISIWKQISASIQAAAASLAGTLTVATHAVTQSGSWVLSAGAALIGKVGIDQTTPGTTNAVNIAALASGGYTTSHLIATNTTNATSLKASAGTVGFIQLGSLSTTAIAYLKLYDKASAPVPASDTPVQVYIIPYATGGAGNNPQIPIQGLNFATGIAYAVTGGIADNDNTAVAAATFAINIGYK